MQAIETVYQGYRFRSRLEARWAVYFDALGLKWEYEKEGYDVEGTWYLPDFWLPSLGIWIEIKPEDGLTEEYHRMLEQFRDGASTAIAVFEGLPEGKPGWIICNDLTDSGGGNYGYWGDGPELHWAVHEQFGPVLATESSWSSRIYCNGGWDGIRVFTKIDHVVYPHPQIQAAALYAKQARFEYGENPSFPLTRWEARRKAIAAFSLPPKKNGATP